MADYRLYRLDGADQIAGAAEPIVADDDETAVAMARAARSRSPLELWQGRRLVARIDPAN